MTKPRPAKKPSSSKGPSRKNAGPGRGTPSSNKGSSKGPSKGPNRPSKPVNPFGEKKRPQGGKKPLKGKKNFKRRDDENLEIILSDRDAATVATIKRKLQEIREYKKILAEDGLKPDQQDKERESELIVRLLRMEKNAKMEARQRAKAAKTEAFRLAAEKAEFAKQKKKSREDRFSDDDSDDDDYRPRKRRGDDYDDDY